MTTDALTEPKARF